MKMNKEVKNYIASLVEKKAATKRAELTKAQYEAEAKCKATLDKFQKDIDAVTAPVVGKIEALMKKYGISHETDWRGVREPVEIRVDGVGGDNKALNDAYSKASAKVCAFDEKVRTTVGEVIAKLSLGGTAEDLERIVSELKF